MHGCHQFSEFFLLCIRIFIDGCILRYWLVEVVVSDRNFHYAHVCSKYEEEWHIPKSMCHILYGLIFI